MSDSVEGVEPTMEDVIRVAADRLVWIRLLEKSLNDVDTVLSQLKADINELNSAMNNRVPLMEEEE